MADGTARPVTGPAPEVLEAPLVLEYPFNRTTGPVIGAFLTALRDRRVLGIRGDDGRVICPPAEFDPVSGAVLTEMVEVAPTGVVESWSWVATPREGQPLEEPHALALIRLDGADTAMLHVIEAPRADEVEVGSRVSIRWVDEPEGLITDIACFEVVAPEGE